jgi:GntR family transcriptional regulator, transcriptional repressor for pyruvate dehydrogenase complex
VALRGGGDGHGGIVPTTKTTRSREKPEQIADELRALIVSGELADGESLGREPDLVERFGVSRPSLREALRILEAEGLIEVVRGVLGGVIVHRPNERMTARTAALVLQSRNVTLGDVHQARSMIEPAAVRVLASSRRGSGKAVEELKAIVEEQRAVIDDAEAFGQANAKFHERLVELAGNQTLSIVGEMLNEIVARAVTAVSRSSRRNSLKTRQRGIRSQERLIELIAIGASNDAEAHWRTHMDAVGKVMIGHMAKTVVDLLNHY